MGQQEQVESKQECGGQDTEDVSSREVLSTEKNNWKIIWSPST